MPCSAEVFDLINVTMFDLTILLVFAVYSIWIVSWRARGASRVEKSELSRGAARRAPEVAVSWRDARKKESS